MRVAVILFFSIAIQQKGFSQNIAYKATDSIMRNYREKIRTEDDLYKLVYYIRTNFLVDSLRLRASFVWITENIDYDVKAYLKGDPKAAQLSYVIKEKRAVCGGYAFLLKYFCDAFEIENEIIDGYARAGKKSVYLNQNNLKPNHAWNAVKIHNIWRLMDATWAAGIVDESNEEDLKYIKDFNELYYFIPPEKIILNHLPRQSKFQFLIPLVNEFTFKKQPLFTSAYLLEDIQKIYPDTALLKVKKGDTLVIKLQSPSHIERMCAFSDKLEKVFYSTKLVKNGDWFEFHYPVQVSGYYNLYIGYCDSRGSTSLIGYKLEVR